MLLAIAVHLVSKAAQPSPEALLWTRRAELPAHWEAVAQYLALRLGHYLQVPVVAESPTTLSRRSFAVEVRAPLPLAGAWQLEWTGVLAVADEPEDLRITASLVLFSQRRRLQLTGHVGSSLELVFERGGDGRGYWTCLGWHEDVLGLHEEVEL